MQSNPDQLHRLAHEGVNDRIREAQNRRLVRRARATCQGPLARWRARLDLRRAAPGAMRAPHAPERLGG